MNKIIQWHQNLTTGKRLIVYIIGTIVLGSVGSGIWAKILSPAIDIGIDKLIGFISKLSIEYKNGIYKEASKGFHEAASMCLMSTIYFFFSGFVIGVLGAYYAQRKRTKLKEDKSILSIVDNFMPRIILIFFFLYYSGHLAYTASKHNYINELVTSSLNSIEIVHPYVGEQKYAGIRSEFFSIQSAEDYKIFYNELKTIEDEKMLGKLRLKEPL